MSEQRNTSGPSERQEPKGGCRAVLVYQDFEMALRGRAVCDLFARETGFCGDTELTVWNYSLLESPDLAWAAGVCLQEADLVVFAARDCNRLPAAVQAWLEDWAPRRKIGRGAWVAVFPPQLKLNPKASNVGLLLLRAAGRAGMDFFCRSPELPAGEPGALPDAGAQTSNPEQAGPRMGL
jgi:hypothetical protein